MEEVIREARRLSALMRRRPMVDVFRLFLDENPTLNQQRHERGWTVLQYACRLNMPRVVELLLRIPGIDVNRLGCEPCYSPVMVAIAEEHTECMRMLLEDPRVDHLVPPDYQVFKMRGVLDFALNQQRHLAIRWVMALINPQDFVVMHAHTFLHTMFGANATLLRDYLNDPAAMRHQLRVELGIQRAQAARLFALFLLLSDGFFTASAPAEGAERCRLLRIALRLPLELQMVLAWRACGNPIREVVHREDFEPAIVDLAT